MNINMENIKEYLTSQIKLAYDKKFDTVIDPKYMSILYYCTNDGIKYCFRSLTTLSKILCKPENELYDILITEIDKTNFYTNFDKNSIAIMPTNNFLNTNIIKLFKNNFSFNFGNARTILVDFSSPNIAKDMHVGHLRSTILGDSICKLLEFQGNHVHRINHIGDFGLQFGMIIEHLLEKYPKYNEHQFTISDLQTFYGESKIRFDSDKTFQKNAYDKVVKLQSGDETIISAWTFIKDISRKSYNEIYEKLDIKLIECGESFYQNKIPDMIKELEHKKILISDDSPRKIIKFDDYDLPLTICKSDGGYTYDTTDLAAIRYRLVDLNVDEIIYVVDNGQSLHFDLIFKTSQLANWKKSHQILKHIGFGVVLDSSGKKFKSRSGDTVKLNELLNEAISRSNDLFIEHRKNNAKSIDMEEKNNIINAIAYSSLKYADLSSIRTNDYKFSFDKMLSFKGNTATYLLYEYVRLCAILRNAYKYINIAMNNIDTFSISESEEKIVCEYIILFKEIIERTAKHFYFNILCTYIYDLANVISVFHKNCRCIQFDENNDIKSVNYSRIIICVCAKKIMEFGFNILGIKIINKM